MSGGADSHALFPTPSHDYISAFQFSSWYPMFSHVSIKSTILKPPPSFREYLLSDGIFMPDGSEDCPPQSTLSNSDDEGNSESGPLEYESDEEEFQNRYSFPELDTHIRQAVELYGAVFPKLNFSSPKDASWILPPSSPLKCTTPVDVYTLLKSSDFVLHDLLPEQYFEGCESTAANDPLELELILRKWYPMEPSREVRCFVRDQVIVGISQRDDVFYEFLMDSSMQEKIVASIVRLWESEIRSKFAFSDYVFDVLLTRDFSRGHILDFNPYLPKTDPLLFSYQELSDMLRGDRSSLPLFKILDSQHRPAVALKHQHNMVPLELFSIGEGLTVDQFAASWQHELVTADNDNRA